MLRNIRATALALLAALPGLATAPALTAQEEPRGEFGERIEVNEVLLDVIVTDSRGNAIIGLTPDDFVVQEDGRPVELTGATFYSSRRLLSSPETLKSQGARVDPVPEDRYFILFFDDQKDAAAEAPGLVARQLEAGRQAREWVRSGRQPADWVAVVSYDRKLKVHQDFTRDGRALAEAVGDAIKGKDREANWPSRVQQGEGPSLLTGLPRGNELRDRTETIYDALEVLAEAAGDIRGRKNLVLFTTGFGQLNSFGQYVPDQRYYPDMARALNDNNVAVYSVDLVPVGTTHALSSAMTHLSEDTGGRYYGTFTSFSTPLKQIAEENSGYYLLSYRSEQPAGERGFQEVEVDTVNPDLRVRARKGYGYGGTTTPGAQGS